MPELPKAPEGLTWHPERSVFARRCLILAVLTFLFFSLPALLFATLWLQSLLMPFAMTLIFALDDFNRWRHVKDERWQLNEAHLIHDGQHGQATISLTEIARVKHRFGSAVVIKLHSGQKVMMRYLSDPAGITQHLNNALDPEQT